MATKAVSWRDVRAKAKLDPAKLAQARQRELDVQRAFRLAQVRRSQARTQLEVAREMGVSQSRVSSIERGEMSRTELGTLDAYVSAMGGRLRVVAEFEDGTVALH
ncbi:helix-turn-helix domain-containing protein [Nocardia farcinica]|uniref:helix-turn-helix domain-containing protein n=1 Tax=Nocardia farcinica TaxID=37329 RepID=UPI000C0199C8|nr:putative antitoxin HigA2 [Nocardia farcinica]PFX04588.1 putative antitoxin HigA2 [Nocardia farcinica]SUE31325.1 transcriptional regulator, y4mF family [Nocardia farcinica]